MPLAPDGYTGELDVPAPASAPFRWPSQEELWRDCLNYLGKRGNSELSPAENEQICRETLHLPWYSHTRYEPVFKWMDIHTRPAGNWISLHLVDIGIAALAVVIIALVWIGKSALARVLFAFTGYDVRRIVDRWRTFGNTRDGSD